MTAAPGFSGRLLGIAGTNAPDAADGRLDAFRRFLLLTTATESWHALHYPAYSESRELHVGIAVGLTACAVVGWGRRFAQPGAIAAAALLAADLASVFPENANHQFVGLVCMTMLALTNPEIRQQRISALQGLRWILLIGFCWAGIQKIFHGYYFGGEFLAVRVATDPNFAAVLQHALSPAELERLLALRPGRGVGPYRVSEPLFLAISHGAYLAELLLPVLLLFRRTRALGIAGMLLFLVAIESGAREVFFGSIMASLALLFAKRDWNTPALPFFVAAAVYLLLVSAGFLPSFGFG